MQIRTYKNRLSGQSVQILIPNDYTTIGKISCGIASPDDDIWKSRSPYFHNEVGKVHFIYHDRKNLLMITYIEVRESCFCSGLGSLLLFELVNAVRRWFPGVSRVFAHKVVKNARGFYLQLGFRPVTEHFKENIRCVPAPDGDVDFPSKFFQNKKEKEDVFYQTSSGVTVTRYMFDHTAHHESRDSLHWEASPLTLMEQARIRSVWDYVYTEQNF